MQQDDDDTKNGTREFESIKNIVSDLEKGNAIILPQNKFKVLERIMNSKKPRSASLDNSKKIKELMESEDLWFLPANIEYEVDGVQEYKKNLTYRDIIKEFVVKTSYVYEEDYKEQSFRVLDQERVKDFDYIDSKEYKEWCKSTSFSEDDVDVDQFEDGGVKYNGASGFFSIDNIIILAKK